MPELPEVETVRRGLAPVLEGATIIRVETRRRDLRTPFPPRFAERLAGARITRLGRRGKYLVAELDTHESLIMHLGMSGRFSFDGAGKSEPDGLYYSGPPDPAHDHVVFHLQRAGGGASRAIYNDPRRFGLMDLAATAAINECRHFKDMGPEPLSAEFSAARFNEALCGQAAIKAALLDQTVVAGVGNIYACEALYRAGVSPRRMAASVAGARGLRLHRALIAVLNEAIEAGGSTLRNFAASNGAIGAFQERFLVYNREGEPCRGCGRAIRRLVQSGRSTFYCAHCQR
jgi:formamidopyrimidine-DNA glycosylase